MAYVEKYNFNFFSTRDLRSPLVCDEYEVRILQDAESATPIEIEAQENPVIINYNNSSDDKLLALRGSECTLNLIATEDFQLEDLYTENERNWLVRIGKKTNPKTFNVSWSANQEPGGLYIDMDLQIFVNGINVVNTFVTASGSFTINSGDTLLVKGFAAGPSLGDMPGMNIEITGLPTQRTVTYPFSIDTTLTPTSDIIINAYTTYSATTYTAIRSAVFTKVCGSGYISNLVTFTKQYTSTVSQSAAQALADADTAFTSDGQSYANTNGVCSLEYSIIWNGFIIPDGCQESFAYTPYTIQVNAVDGLGLLKNLSFAQNDGNFFLGKKTWIDIIYGCLNRLGIPNMDIYTCVNIYEQSMTQGDANDPLALSYVNAERFIKDDQYSPMDCQEVLQAVLQEWTACIVQSEGHWWIYRPNEAAVSGTLKFRKYVNGVYNSVVTKNIDVLLGGYSEGTTLAPLYHVNTDQLKMIEKPYKTASIAYKYGFRPNVLSNPDFVGATVAGAGDPAGPRTDVTIPEWTKYGTIYNGLDSNGVIFYKVAGFNELNYFENTETVEIGTGRRIKIDINYESIPDGTATDMIFGVEFNNGVSTYYLQPQEDGIYRWDDTLPYFKWTQLRSDQGISSGTIISAPVPQDGTIKFKIYPPDSTSGDIIYSSIKLSQYKQEGEQIGEIHTVEQEGQFSYVPDTINVFNGDDESDFYLGTIFKTDQSTPTVDWVRRGYTEFGRPFLRVAVEEIQRMYALPFVKFEGSIANYFNPLSRFTINLINGKFMPTGLSYDLQANICKATLTRVSNADVLMEYTLEPDYGETKKVLVK